MRVAILCVALMACGGGDDDGGGGGGGEPEVVLMEAVGPEGGSFEGDGVRVDVPPESLASEIELTVTAQNRTVSGYTMQSAVFTFEPADVTMAEPITLEIQTSSDDGTLFYTSETGGTYEATDSAYADGWVGASVGHLGSGFVGKPGETGGACEPACTGDQVCVGGVCQDY